MKGKVDFHPSIRQPISLKKGFFSGPHSRRSLCIFCQYSLSVRSYYVLGTHTVSPGAPLMLFGKHNSRKVSLVIVLLLTSTPWVRSADDGGELDVYKIRLTGLWWFSSPTGSFHGQGTTSETGAFDLSKDFGFGSYSTFSGKVDWRFKRKHHLLVGIFPISSTRTNTLDRTFTFQGQTFDVGATVKAHIDSSAYAPGYQYDIIRRNRINLSIPVQVFLGNVSASLTTTGSVNSQSGTKSASGSIFAALPVAGPAVRWYPTHTSRYSIDGQLQGMYFFGYGNFLTAKGSAGIAINRHLNFRAGYQLGRRLKVNDSESRVGIVLIQKGPTAGLEASW